MNRRLLLVLATIAASTLACSGGGDDDDSATVPAAPSGLTAALMDGKPHLTWDDNSDDETGFVIERMVTGTGSFAEVGSETYNVEQFHDMGAPAGTGFTYRVLAENDTGLSEPSNEFQIATP